jgi:uncharacterized protein HemX
MNESIIMLLAVAAGALFLYFRDKEKQQAQSFKLLQFEAYKKVRESEAKVKEVDEKAKTKKEEFDESLKKYTDRYGLGDDGDGDSEGK